MSSLSFGNCVSCVVDEEGFVVDGGSVVCDRHVPS